MERCIGKDWKLKSRVAFTVHSSIRYSFAQVFLGVPELRLGSRVGFRVWRDVAERAGSCKVFSEARIQRVQNL